MYYMIIIIFVCAIRVQICSLVKENVDGKIKGNSDKFSSKNDDNDTDLWKKKQASENFHNTKFQPAVIPQKEVLDDIKKTEQCDNEFIMKLFRLLDNFNISLQYNDIENLRTFIKVKTASRDILSGLHFVIVLNLKRTYPEYGDEETKRIFETDDLTSLAKEPLFSTNFEKNPIENTKLVLTMNNLFSSNKSLIHIKMDINFARNEENTYSHSKKGGPISNFFENKNTWNRKKMIAQRFTSGSIFAGSILALLSSILCGLSFALKKLSLVKMDKNKCFYFDKRWLMGHSLMMIGDVFHFTAFFFAPAIVVCTLQILTVIVTAIASAKLLGEKLHKHGKLAFALSLGGCWVIVFHVPNEPHIYSIDTLLYLLSSHIFLIYISFLSIVTILLTSYWIPKYGDVNSLGYTILCAIFGSVIVLGLKGVILGYTDTFSHWLPWMSLSVVVVFLFLQLEYLNKALIIYNTLIVTTQYYVFYSAFVILASTLLFKLWKTSSQETIFTNFCGLFTIALGALILTIFEEGNARFDFSKLFAGPEIRHKIK